MTRGRIDGRTGAAGRGSGSRALRAAVLAAVACVTATAAVAQGFSWPWSEPERKPVPREPVYRPAPPAAPGAAPPAGYATQPPPFAANGARSNICLQLEQRLVQESQKGSQSRDLLPKVEADLKAAQRAERQAEQTLERSDCYEIFLFSKTLRRSRQCVDLANQAEAARRKIGELDSQRQQLMASGGRSYQDDIIRELARNNCGGGYQQEARKREGSVWLDEEGGGYSGSGNQFGALPYATYRTICVRLCDGYYFPISFSTLPNHFQRDADACQSKCAAPVELYYHQNPGGAVEQAVAAKSQEPYSKLKTAFRYRKEFVSGCSCKQAEYTPIPGQLPADRRADASDGAKKPPAATTGAVQPSSSSWEAQTRSER